MEGWEGQRKERRGEKGEEVKWDKKEGGRGSKKSHLPASIHTTFLHAKGSVFL